MVQRDQIYLSLCISHRTAYKRLIKYASIYFYTSKGRATVNSKKLLYVMCFILLLLGIAGTVWAQGAAYNRPNPSMDYVPQELGIYDTMYYELTEHNCRNCHGNSTADRHQGVPMVVRDHLCYPCHPTCTEGAPDCENGITIHSSAGAATAAILYGMNCSLMCR